MAIWKRIRKYKNKDTSEDEREIQRETEKGDFRAMWFSAMLTIWLPCVLILVAFGFLALSAFT